MMGPANLYDDRLPPGLRGRLTTEESISYLAAEQAEEIARERLRTEGNRKARRAAARARRRG